MARDPRLTVCTHPNPNTFKGNLYSHSQRRRTLLSAIAYHAAASTDHRRGESTLSVPSLSEIFKLNNKQGGVAAVPLEETTRTSSILHLDQNHSSCCHLPPPFA